MLGIGILDRKISVVVPFKNFEERSLLSKII